MKQKILNLLICCVLITAILEPVIAKGKETRLEKLYTKGKYERCLKKCNRMLSRELTSVPYYYLTFINFHHFKSPETDKAQLTENYLESTIINLSFALQIDSNEIYRPKYSRRLTEIKDTLISKNQRLLEAEKFEASQVYAQKLWELFSDSTALIAGREATKMKIPLNTKPVMISESPTLEELTRSLLVARAENLEGIKYIYGGENPETGFDCSGYVQYLYNGLGFKLPRTSYWQSTKGVEIDESEAQPGDLIFFSARSKDKGGINHVGLVRASDNGSIAEFIHSANGGVSKTKRGTQNFEYWYNRIASIKNVLSVFLHQFP